MTVDLYMHWRTPYNPAVAGLTVEAWEDSLFSHSPVGNPSAYPPASSPTATTTTDSSGNCELTGLTAGTNYYVSIIDENNKPWFLFCGATYLGNPSTTPRQFSIIQGPVAVEPTVITQKGELVFVGALPPGGAGLAWASGGQTIVLSNIRYDPFAGGDGTGFTVPAALAGQQLRAEASVNFGGTTAALGGPGTFVVGNEVALTYNASAFALDGFSVPNGSIINYSDSLELGGYTFAAPTAAGDTIRLTASVNTSGGSAMYWGQVGGSGLGLYTQMRIFTC